MTETATEIKEGQRSLPSFLSFFFFINPVLYELLIFYAHVTRF
jgi:hypothetical protein